MKCLICKRTFSVKKNFSSLFLHERYLICDKCYKSYPIKIGYTVFPLTNHQLFIYSLYPKPYFINPLAYSYEYSKIFSYVYQKSNMADIYMAFDTLRISKQKFDIFDELSSFYDKDIYIICNYLAD